MPVMQRAAAGTRLVILAAVAVSLTACDVMMTGLNAKGKAEDKWSRTYSLSADGEIEVTNTNGGVEVTGADVSQVEVVVDRIVRAATDDLAREHLRDVDIREHVTPDRVTLETSTPRSASGWRAETRYSIRVPRSLRVRVRNLNGSVALTDLSGKTVLESENGAVRGTDLRGPLEATTTNGSIRLTFAAVASGGIRVETTNGSVDLTIPAATRAEVKARCVNGRVSLTGLTLEGEHQSVRRRVEGRLNGGGPLISLESTNGSVRLTGK